MTTNPRFVTRPPKADKRRDRLGLRGGSRMKNQMTTKPKTIDTSAGRVHKNPIAELMREAGDKLDQSGLPCQGLVEDLLDAADEIERQEPVATLCTKGHGPIEVMFTEATEFGTKLPDGTKLYAARAGGGT